ncbi:MAG: G5 domain-containing protein [Anaerolineae bacterium]
MRRSFFVLLFFILTAAACNPPSNDADTVRVRLFADGQQITLSTTEPLTVAQLLARNNITLGALDRIDPADFTLVKDNMTVTIVRVRDETECASQEVPYETQKINVQELKPDETRILQAGVAGEAKVCFRVLYEDNVEKSRTQSSYTLLKPAQPQLIAVGVDNKQLEPFEFSGTLVYLSNGQAYTIEGNTTKQGALNTGGNLDGKVFALSPDARQLLYTRKPDDQQGASGVCNEANELWVLLDLRDPNAQPVKIGKIFNVLTADWIPGQSFAFSYSTFSTRPDIPCYTALNDLILARVDGKTGDLVAAEPKVTGKPGGIYGAWGTNFAWSPDGSKLAWAQAEGIGVVDLTKGDYVKLMSFPAYTTTLTLGWLWKPSITWSADGNLIVAAVHGAALTAGDPADTSPVFDVAVVQAANQFQINPTFSQTGMWAAPRSRRWLRIGGYLNGVSSVFEGTFAAEQLQQ